ncbi:hypothetical protein [Streptomyces sp. NPDC005485]|uniref:hypothetical protein n=1 Tax=Streptomyces sp. NPDC005485 TaxID=3155591 RepID=UPI0033A774CD
MAAISLKALEDVPWDRLESALPQHPVTGVPRALRRLALAGGAATDEDCGPLFSCLAAGNGRVTSAATAALPFVLALAADPGMAVRVTLVDLLHCMVRTAATAEPHLVDKGWATAWEHHRPAILALLADPDPEVRRSALSLAGDAAPLLERRRAETDPTLRVSVLLALGEAAAAGGAGDVEETRAVLADLMREGEPVMKVAAVHAWASLAPEVPVQHADLLLETLSDPSLRPRFEEVWYVPGVDDPFNRDDVARWTAGLFDHTPDTAISFLVRLAGRAHRPEDTGLRRTVLDEAWRLLVVRPSAAPALLTVAGDLLTDPDDEVRLKAANLLAVLGPRAAAYADGLAELVDDPGEYLMTEGSVGDFARWALARIGDPRALPGLVERLYEPYREQYSRSYCAGDPRLPDIDDILVPLRAHADVLLLALRNVMRHHDAHHGAPGPLTGAFLRVLEAWGPASLPALPEVMSLLNEPRDSWLVADVVAAMGPAAASAAPALRNCTTPDRPELRTKLAWTVWRIGEDDGGSALRSVGDAVLHAQDPNHGPLHLLADFGPAAAPYGDRVRHIMEHTVGGRRLQAAITLWSITGEPQPSLAVLEEFVLPAADGGDDYTSFGEALRALPRIGTATPALRAALRTVQRLDHRLTPYRDYRAFLDDESLRGTIAEVLAMPA